MHGQESLVDSWARGGKGLEVDEAVVISQHDAQACRCARRCTGDGEDGETEKRSERRIEFLLSTVEHEGCFLLGEGGIADGLDWESVPEQLVCEKAGAPPGGARGG